MDGDRVLLARRTYGPPVWALLGGTALPDEAPDVAARREVEEESGLQVTTDRLVVLLCEIGSLMIFIFVGRVVSGTERRQPEEIAELHWFRQVELEHEPVFNVVPLLVAALGNGRDRVEPGLSLEMVPWPDGMPHPVFMVARSPSG